MRGVIRADSQQQIRTTMSNKIKVGITHGDYNGVSYEVTLRALANEGMTDLFTPVFYGIPALLEETSRRLEIPMPAINLITDAADAKAGVINVVSLTDRKVTPEPGKPTPESGKAAVKALELASRDALDGKIDALVTAPISKEAVQNDNFHFVGHTEFLGERANAKPRMILFDDKIRVALLTTHKAISDIPATVTRDAIKAAVEELDASLRLDFDFEAPKIAILALNPHCGDGGLLGTEEIREITPAVKELSEKYLTFGPFAADGFFASGAWRHYDGILAMYHDQGLAPFKALAGAEGVNFTAGLPYVRTSPDHGTAYDIAWKGVADPTSMLQAIYAAIDLTRNRRRNIAAKANPLPKMPEKSRDSRHDKESAKETQK